MSDREEELLDLHRELVRIPSVNRGDGSSARETEVATTLATYLNRAEIESRIVESAPGRGNLLARWRAPIPGSPLGHRLLFMGHADVVPPGDESRWRFPPFSAERANGRIWGRGTNDCKMLVACEAFAMASIARSGELVSGEIRLAVGADEEAGGKFGFGWLEEHESEFLKADLAINEGGGAYLTRGVDDRETFLVGTGEKGRYEVIFSVEGPGTHASVPWGRMNPAVRIAELAASLSAWSSLPLPGAPILPGFRETMGLLGDPASESLGLTFEAARRLSKSFYNSLMAQTRMTLVPTVLRSGDKSNAVPTSAELRCDGRLLPGQARRDLEEAIVEILKGFPDIAWRIEETAGSSVSELPEGTTGLFEQATARALNPEGSIPEGKPLPRMLPSWCTGFTDSRFARAVGTPTYGYQLVIPQAEPDRLGIHCIDESIEQPMLLPCALSLAHLALEFCERG
jgi:acetylornithine deacetylase/succinyl-diaminopimelate desuccinylase-like protein